MYRRLPSMASASTVFILLMTLRIVAQKAAPPSVPTNGTKAICPSTLFKSPPFPSPASVWESDTSYIPAIKADAAGSSSAYVVADKLDLTKDTFPSLFRTRRRPNDKVTHIVLDGRDVNIDMPIVFDTTTLVIYAHRLRFGPRGSIVFTNPPKETDGLTIVTDELDLSGAALHPFVFVTRSDTSWPATSKRLITVIANHVTSKTSSSTQDYTELFASLTLDKNYARYSDGSSTRLKPYTVNIGTTTAKQSVQEYTATRMLWPLETSEKIARQFSKAPFDPQNTTYLSDKIKDLDLYLPPNSHPLARSVAAQTLRSINLRTDIFGLPQSYVPRLIYPEVEDAFKAQQSAIFHNIQHWDDELVNAQAGRDKRSTGAVDNVEQEITKEVTSIQEYNDALNEDMKALAEKESQIVHLTGKIEEYRQDDQRTRDEDNQKAHDVYVGRIIEKGVLFAASLIPVSAPVAISIMVTATVADNQIAAHNAASFQEGSAPSLPSAIRDIPGVLKDAQDFYKKTTTAVDQWSDVKAKYAAYQKQSTQTTAAPDTKKPADSNQKDQPSASAQYRDSVIALAGSLNDIVSSLNVPQPTTLNQDDYDAKNVELQKVLHQVGDIRNEEGTINKDLVRLNGLIIASQGKVETLNGQRVDLNAIDVQDDVGMAQRESIAWAARQDELRELLNQAVILLRSYKYFTLQNPTGQFNERYMEQQYRLSGGIEQPGDLTSSGNQGEELNFFNNPGRNNLEARLKSRRDQLQHDIEALLSELDAQYQKFQNAYYTRTPSALDHPILCKNLRVPSKGERRDINCEFVRAVNDEIAWQINHPNSERYQAEIPIPLKIAREHNQTPSRLYGSTVQVVFDDPSLAKGVTMKLIVEHPFFGELWGQKNDDCTFVDMRKPDDLITLQPYPSTCNEARPCNDDLDNAKLLKSFEEQNQKYAPLPLETIYFLKPIVEQFDIQRSSGRPPRVTEIHIKLWSVN